MEEKIQELYESINFLGFHATYHRDNNYVENSKGVFSQVQEFVQWFMEQQFGRFGTGNIRVFGNVPLRRIFQGKGDCLCRRT